VGYKGSRSDKGFMVMVLLVCSIGGARGVVEYVSWPDGIASGLCESEDAVVRCREQMYNLHVVPGEVGFVALCLLHWRGPRGCTHGKCLPVRGQHSKEQPSCGVGGRGCTWG